MENELCTCRSCGSVDIELTPNFFSAKILKIKSGFGQGGTTETLVTRNSLNEVLALTGITEVIQTTKIVGKVIKGEELKAKIQEYGKKTSICETERALEENLEIRGRLELKLKQLKSNGD